MPADEEEEKCRSDEWTVEKEEHQDMKVNNNPDIASRKMVIASINISTVKDSFVEGCQSTCC